MGVKIKKEGTQDEERNQKSAGVFISAGEVGDYTDVVIYDRSFRDISSSRICDLYKGGIHKETRGDLFGLYSRFKCIYNSRSL